MNINYFLYHVCVESEVGQLDKGYVGITNDYCVRFKQHEEAYMNYLEHIEDDTVKDRKVYKEIDKAKDDCEDVVAYVVYCGDKESTINLERELRPEPNMAWNTKVGGDMSLNERVVKGDNEKRQLRFRLDQLTEDDEKRLSYMVACADYELLPDEGYKHGCKIATSRTIEYKYKDKPVYTHFSVKGFRYTRELVEAYLLSKGKLEDKFIRRGTYCSDTVSMIESLDKGKFEDNTKNCVCKIPANRENFLGSVKRMFAINKSKGENQRIFYATKKRVDRDYKHVGYGRLDYKEVPVYEYTELPSLLHKPVISALYSTPNAPMSSIFKRIMEFQGNTPETKKLAAMELLNIKYRCIDSFGIQVEDIDDFFVDKLRVLPTYFYI